MTRRRLRVGLWVLCLAWCGLMPGCGPEVDRSELHHVVFEVPPIPLDAAPGDAVPE